MLGSIGVAGDGSMDVVPESGISSKPSVTGERTLVGTNVVAIEGFGLVDERYSSLRRTVMLLMPASALTSDPLRPGEVVTFDP